MRIITPTEIEHVAWEGYLESLGETFREALLPRVTLGEPTWWPAEQAMESETGKKWTPPAGDWRYTLLRLACTPAPARRPAGTLRRGHPHRLPAPSPRRCRGDRCGPRPLPAVPPTDDKGKFTIGLGPDYERAERIGARMEDWGRALLKSTAKC